MDYIRFEQDREYQIAASQDLLKFQARTKHAWVTQHWAHRLDTCTRELIPEPPENNPTNLTIKFTTKTLLNRQINLRRRFDWTTSTRQLFMFIYFSGMIDAPPDENADFDDVQVELRNLVGSISCTLDQLEQTTSIGDFLGTANVALLVVQHPILFTLPIPNHNVPNPSIPNHSVPNHSVPNHNIPNHSVPNHSVPNHSVPNHSVPNYSVPNHNIIDLTEY